MASDKTLPKGLKDLIARLEQQLPAPTVGEIMRLLGEADLDLHDFNLPKAVPPASVETHPVWYESRFGLLLTVTPPGQGTSPHDQSGGMSVVRVLAGRGCEAIWTVGADGYADIEYETPLAAGDVVGWHDNGIHSIRNADASRQQLVTLHVHVPPNATPRRFVPRPTKVHGLAREYPRGSGTNRQPAVLVIGGGFSGTAVAMQLLRQGRRSGCIPRILLVERSGSVGEGIAYGTRDSTHLLNVLAGRMSALPDAPGSFLDWARQRDPTIGPGDYLPRAWYAEYLRATLFAEASCAPGALQILADEVRRLGRHPAGGWMAHFRQSPSMRADVAVLAIGHREPDDPLAGRWSGPRDRFLADPWRPPQRRAIRPADDVVIVGSGLSAVDSVLSLTATPRSGSITMVSRNGLLPGAHSEMPSRPADLSGMLESWSKGGSLLDLVRRFRQQVVEGSRKGEDWRGIVDGIRPWTARIWQTLSRRDRQRFVRRLRPWWEIHRHRMAPQVARRLQVLLDGCQVRIVAGKLLEARAGDRTVEVRLKPRNQAEGTVIHCQWVINCTGPRASSDSASNPVIASLLNQGLIVADSIGPGLVTSPDGEAIDASGLVVADLLVIGTLRKPQLWESTAVPELRVQAEVIASRVLAGLSSRKLPELRASTP